MRFHVAILMIVSFAAIMVFSIAVASEFNPLAPASWDQNVFLKFMILAIGTILCIAFTLGKKPGWGKYSVRVIALTLIITAALFIAICNNSNGGSSQDTAPLWGLLGAIAGYVLGEYGKEENENEKTEKNDHLRTQKITKTMSSMVERLGDKQTMTKIKR